MYVLIREYLQNVKNCTEKTDILPYLIQQKLTDRPSSYRKYYELRVRMYVCI